MPLSSARKDGDKERTAKSQEQELKRARGAISCAECRRLKLKCDKTVPCSSCKRRGCASICPNGSLTTGQGTRFILADTDRLHRKIAEMSDRIRQLEDGLAILQSSVTRELHPLLAPDLLKIKSGLELHAAAEGILPELAKEREAEPEEEAPYIDAFGTLAVRDDGAATFYGRSAGSESLLLDEKPHQAISTLSQPSSGHPDLHPEINRLASAFPHGPTDLPIFDLQDIITTYLPPWPRARELRELYLEQAPWFFGAVTRRQLTEEVFPLFYQEAQDEVGAAAAQGFVGSADAFNLPNGAKQQASSHELGLMLVVFCFGALTDASLPAAPHNVEAERYYQLTRAALSLEPVMDRPPSVATVQVLSLMAIYQGMVADERSIESTWALMGLSSKLAQSTGLHRDASRFKLSTAETQKRRALFWELFITDCWQALATGRLPTFELQYVDTELPADPDETLSDDGTPMPSFPAWKARWGKECISPVVMGTLTAQPPKYSVILELDRRIRDMPLPKYSQGPPPQNVGLSQTMSYYMPINYLHFTLLYVHRCFFANALMDHPTDPMRSQYAPSFLAGYRSACTLLSTLREQFSLFPNQIARFWVLWTHAFSACVMMGSVVARGGVTKNAQAALGELRLACDLFERAAQHGGRACKFVPILRKINEKAQAAYFQGLQPLRRDIFSTRSTENEQDELAIFSGRTPRTVVTKSNRPQRISPSMSSSSTVSPPDNHSSPSSGSQNGSVGSAEYNQNQRSSQSPATEAFPGLDSAYLPAVHPGLISELRSFEGQLDAQIHQTNSYYASGAQQQQYAEMQQDPQWYQAPGPAQAHMHAAVDHAHAAHHPSVSPPGTEEQQYQPMQQYPNPNPHSQTQSPEQHLQPQHSFQQRVKAPQPLPPPPLPTAVPQQQQHPHDIPMYGGVYSKDASAAQYQDPHPYAQYDYAAYASHPEHAAQPAHGHGHGHGHSMPDQRSELWTVPPGADVHAEDGDVDVDGDVDGGGGGGGDGGQMSYHQTQTAPEQQQVQDHLASHAQYRQVPRHGHAQPQVQGQHSQHPHLAQHPQHAQLSHPAHAQHPHAQHSHPQHLQHPQQAHPQHVQQHPHAVPPPLQPQHTGQSMHHQPPLQPQHTGQSMHYPPPLQPQHTGQGVHHQYPAQPQYAQGQAYAYSPPHHQQQPPAYPQQQQMMSPPAPAPQYQQQQQPVVSNGYSLTETWTSFIQQELPGPPGVARR
ncbi:hypothetical protein L226DRAFT_612121 [Lentinus tigrinus ALCF2SS1-7]|uniref:Zn(2)-C6 fungal-type domain-containing protein n=1 Tax=Lentinus tigrinus ALCF2SS1-6 TaxID=1328759 RepID=A0A5C2SBC3_9APHY|nr:hypothetical protein L227DRAFT_593317 [Lentinus tigrinus ALCF2SS1-6]RPD75818.1 hypothetical protein L226DRAFT_612121 [Lentinus tigrinus ALCF2SS1-7]